MPQAKRGRPRKVEPVDVSVHPKPQYKILCASCSELEQIVCNHLIDGYTLVGGVSISGNKAMQAVQRC